MWILFLVFLTITSGILWYRTRSENKYRFDILGWISLGSLIMFLVDKIYSYVEEGVFVEFTVEALYLGIVLVLTTVMLWLIVLLAKSRLK